MRFLFVLTGGTIGSTKQGEFLDARAPATELPWQYCNHYGITLDYDVIAPYTMLSEQNNGERLTELVCAVKKQLSAGYDGILITHGTDTLAYSAAALGYALGGTCTPVCVVSANAPPQDARSNALANLHGAVRFLTEQRSKGVWVSYQNTGEEIRIHRATRLLESPAFSDRVDSACNAYFGAYHANGSFVPNPNYAEQPDEIPMLSVDGLQGECTQIARISPYVGMKYPVLSPEIRAVLHETYHSGTLNTAASQTSDFFLWARMHQIPVFLTGIHPMQTPYESTSVYESLGAIQLPPAAPAALYIKLWLTLSAGQDPLKVMSNSLCGDLIPIQ